MTASGRPTVAVAGGGITGLVAARALARSAELDVVLIEAESRPGGKLRSADLDGYLIEEGPDSFAAREPRARELCEDLGLADELVAPAVFGAYVWSRGRLRRLPPDLVSGVPASPLGALGSGLLSPRGAARAALELVLPGRLDGPDLSVGALVRRRFGDEVLERLVDPLLAGTRAGRADEMSLAAAAPAIDEVARSHRSLLVGLRAASRSGTAQKGPPPFLGLRSGMQHLVERLFSELSESARLILGRAVRELRAQGAGYVVDLGDERLAADGVVVTVPAFAAARLTRPLAPRLAGLLERTDYASVALVNLAYPPSQWRPPPHSSGILVPSVEGRTIAGCTWTSIKWPHLDPRDGGLLARAFVGRAGRDPALDLDDDALARRVVEDLSEIAGLDARPRAWRVTRWERGLPQYSVGHNDRLAEVDAVLAEHPGMALAGAGYRGSGLPDCIAQAEDAAQRVRRAVMQPPSATRGGHPQGGGTLSRGTKEDK